jgi:hypothetical protein
MQNPEEEERPEVICDLFETHCQIETPKYTTVKMHVDEEKSTDIQLENEYVRNGAAMYIKVKPVSDEKMDE